MSNSIYRSISEPRREGLTWHERWKGPDLSVIACWESGRNLAERRPDLKERALRGELPSMGWKGGVEKGFRQKSKFGTLRYLAQWQGLRGEDLNIDLDEETKLVCSLTGVEVTFTADSSKYAGP